MSIHYRKPRIAKTTAAAILLLALSPVATAQQTTVEIGILSSGRFEAINGALEPAFSTQNPDIQLDFRPMGENWEPALQAALRGAIIEDLPDVGHQSLNHLHVLVDRGMVQPLDTYVSAAGGWESLGYLPAVRDSVTIDGSIYALPFATTVPVLYYNMDIARQAGWDGDDLPGSWDDVFELARMIDALPGDAVSIYLEYQASSAWMFQAFLKGLGGSLMNADRTDIAFDTETGLRALEYIRAFGEAGQFDMSRDQARQAFNAGALGILVRSASGIPGVADAADGNFELRVGQFPLLADIGVLPGAGNGMVMFTGDPQRQQAAWDYMRFAAGPEGQTVLVETTGYVPVNTVAVQSRDYLADYYDAHPFQRATVELMPIMGDWESFPGDNAARIFDLMTEQMRQLIIGETTPEEALSFMAAETRGFLAQN